jgi:hypothetical protein
MSTWVGISPLIGAGSPAGFAVGATVSGAFFLVITAPRRLRRRRAAAAGAPGVPVSARSAEAGTLDAELCRVETFGAGAEAERVAQPQPGAQDEATWTSLTGRDRRSAAYRSRHRLGDPIPGRAARGGASAGRARRSGAFWPGGFPSWASQDDAQPDTPFPDVAFSDVAFPDGTFSSSRRRLPRHAAPAVSFGTKVSGRVTGLFAARPLAGGAPS